MMVGRPSAELAGVDANELLAHAQQVWMPQVQQRMGDRIAVETLDAYSPAMDQSALEVAPNSRCFGLMALA